MNRIPSREYFKAVLFAVIIAAVCGAVSFVKFASLPKQVFLEISLTAHETAVAQVFYDIGNGIREEDSLRQPFHHIDTTQELRFALPKEAVQFIRFDPTNGKKPVDINSIEVVTGQGHVIEKLDLKALNPEPTTTRVELSNQTLTISIPDSAVVLDPQLAYTGDYPLVYEYGNDVYYGLTISIVSVVFIVVLIFLLILRICYDSSLSQFFIALVKWLKSNLYLINKPE